MQEALSQVCFLRCVSSEHKSECFGRVPSLFLLLIGRAGIVGVGKFSVNTFSCELY